MRQKRLQTTRARRLRQDQTEAEKIVWFRLRGRRFQGLKFRRQVPVGPYIVDFLCPSRHLIIELDGGQHTEAGDAARTAFLNARGYRVLRFWNGDVRTNLTGVLQRLAEETRT